MHITEFATGHTTRCILLQCEASFWVLQAHSTFQLQAQHTVSSQAQTPLKLCFSRIKLNTSLLDEIFLSFEGLSSKIKTCKPSLPCFSARPLQILKEKEKQNISETEKSNHLKKKKKYYDSFVFFFFSTLGFCFLFFFFLKFLLQRFHLVLVRFLFFDSEVNVAVMLETNSYGYLFEEH